MKVVLFCGGLGLRMREVSDLIPKPMIPVGKYPILLHVMNYYAHYGHKDFILCLGYKADNIRGFFENSSLGLPSEYVAPNDDPTLECLRRTMSDWNITFADTGLEAKVGERLYAVRDLLQDEEFFLANYADVLTDASLPDMIALMRQRDIVGSFLCAEPTYSFHVVTWKDDHTVADIAPCTQAQIWMNGGYFVFRPEIFDYMEPGDELVEAPFKRLISEKRLSGYRHHGFWAPMDTLKDRQNLCEMYERGERPWMVWEETIAAQTAARPKSLVHARAELARPTAKIA
jgi:glucose-1-phosphate cytidylyltransferase